MTEPAAQWLTDALKDSNAQTRHETGERYGQIIAGFYHGLVTNGVPTWGAIQMCNTWISAAAVAAGRNSNQ